MQRIDLPTNMPFYFLNRFVVLPSMITLQLSKYTFSWLQPILFYTNHQYRKYLKNNTIDVIDGAEFNDQSIYKKVPVYYFFGYTDGVVSDKYRIMPRHDYWLIENAPIYPHLLLYLLLDDFVHSKQINHYFTKYKQELSIDKSKWLRKIKKIKKKCYERLFECQYNHSMIREAFDIDTLYSIYFTYEKLNGAPSQL